MLYALHGLHVSPVRSINMSVLFNDENSDSDGELKINTKYASIYDNFRQKEELHKLKARYGEDAVLSEDESSDSSLSDENEDIQNAEFDKQFLLTLACLKSEDPSMYEKCNNISKSETSENVETKKKEKKLKKEKPLSLRDYERKIILERDGRFSSSEDEDEIKQKSKSKVPTYVEEQKELKDIFRQAVKDEDDDEDNDLLKIKQKTEDEKHKEEESYKEWLKGQEVTIDSKDKEMLKPLRDFWSDPNLDPNEKFLRDYILNNKYMDKESYDVDLEYNQVHVHDSDENLSEDEKTIQKQEEFERKYNFRFEEPDQEFIKRYPRTMENSMRKKDTRRAQKRAEVKDRKEQEKQQKREELKQLKALKRKEIEEKIEKLREITGNDDMHFDNVDFDSDFDPNEHDKRMKEIFNDEYYAGGENEMQKPEFPEIDEELDIESKWDTYDPTTDKIDMESASYEEPHCEDPDFNMDADYDQESQDLQSKLIESTKKRKRKKRSKFAELIAKEKPKFDPIQFSSYADYFDQYYSLDYEDMIGDLPCRFKYRKVVPNDYGLSIEEILMADDKELNRWCPLRQTLKHKPEHVERNEVRIYKEKAMNETHKRKILKSLYAESEEKEEEKDELVTEQTETCNKKHRRKKKVKANNFNVESSNIDTVSKEKAMNIVNNHCHNNNKDNRKEDEQNKDGQDRNIVHNNKKKDKQNKDEQEKNIVHKSKKQKRKNELKTDDNALNSKKIKIDSATKEDCQIKTDTNNIKENEKIINKSPGRKKNKNKNFQYNQTGKRKSDYDDPIMSLNAERLKMYGINAKKLKNKLKYSNNKL